jgi:hypothetical protein
MFPACVASHSYRSRPRPSKLITRAYTFEEIRGSNRFSFFSQAFAPFGITEYTQAAATIDDARKELQTLAIMLGYAPLAATRFGDAMREHAEHLIDYLTKRVIEALGLLFAGVPLIALA